MPTYAGVDSDVKKNLLSLINAFDGHPPDWNLRMGIHGTLTNPRLLDLLGVKYDWDGHDLVVRPNALASCRCSSTSKFVLTKKTCWPV